MVEKNVQGKPVHFLPLKREEDLIIYEITNEIGLEVKVIISKEKDKRLTYRS
jgi:hypothetical protein